MARPKAPTSYTELIRLLLDLPVIVKETRRKRGLSLRATSRITGVAASTLARIEAGDGANLDTITTVLRWVEWGEGAVVPNPKKIDSLTRMEEPIEPAPGAAGMLVVPDTMVDAVREAYEKYPDGVPHPRVVPQSEYEGKPVELAWRTPAEQVYETPQIEPHFPPVILDHVNHFPMPSVDYEKLATPSEDELLKRELLVNLETDRVRKSGKSAELERSRQLTEADLLRVMKRTADDVRRRHYFDIMDLNPEEATPTPEFSPETKRRGYEITHAWVDEPTRMHRPIGEGDHPDPGALY